MKLQHVFEKNKEWISNKLNEDPNYFVELSKGQSPEILYIGCSNSRVTAEELMGLNPGNVFVHRNIANLVINVDFNVLSVIEYAVRHLQVKHIVVCGHYHCGGVKFAMQNHDLGFLNPWLSVIRNVYQSNQKELDAITDEETRYKRFIELNVKEQCINLTKIKLVQDAYKSKLIKLHGWVFDIHSGKLIDLQINFKEIFSHIGDIYKLE